MLALISIDFAQYGRWYLLGAAVLIYSLAFIGKRVAGPAGSLLSYLRTIEYRAKLSSAVSSPKLGWLVALGLAFALWPSPAKPPGPDKTEPAPQPAPAPVDPKPIEPQPVQPQPEPDKKYYPSDLWAKRSEVHRALVVDILKRLITKRQENPDNDQVVGEWLKAEFAAANSVAQDPVDSEIAKAITKGSDAIMQLIDKLQSEKLEVTTP